MAAIYNCGKRLSLATQCLTPELRRKALDELYEDEETRVSGLDALKDLIKNSSDLPHLLTNELLLQFLRARKFDPEKAFCLYRSHFECLQKFVKARYFESRESFPSFLSCITELFDSDVISILPRRDNDGCVVFIFRIDMWDPNKFSWKDVLIGQAVLILVTNLYPATQIAGAKVIIDFRNIKVKQATHLPIKSFNNMKNFIKNFMPTRVIEIHMIIGPSFHILWKLMKFALSRKLRSKMHHHKTVNSIQKFISSSILPVEYAGTYHTINDNHYRTQLMKKSEEYLKTYLEKALWLSEEQKS